MKRRAVLAGLGALAAAPVSAAGVPVFLDYTQDQLDRAYNQSAWVADMPGILARTAAASAAARQAMPPQTERYGAGIDDILDIFAPAGAQGRPVLVFLHGGAWLQNRREDVSFAAPTLAARGAVFVAPDFGGLRTVRMPDMADACRRAVDWTVGNIARFGGDPAQVYLAGHSSGAHLAASTLSAGVPVKAALVLSGIYDLYPVILSSRSAYVHLSTAEQAALSPLRHLDRIDCPVSVLAADGDTPEFRRQAQVFAEALRGMGRLAVARTLFNTNHFQGANQLGDPQSDVSQAVFAMMGL